eukprot:3680728-Amphidinium_carterae.1
MTREGLAEGHGDRERPEHAEYHGHAQLNQLKSKNLHPQEKHQKPSQWVEKTLAGWREPWAEAWHKGAIHPRRGSAVVEKIHAELQRRMQDQEWTAEVA